MFPRWLGWLFIAVIAYLIYVATQNPPASTPDHPSALPAVTPQTYPSLAKVTDTERWKRELNPDYAKKESCGAFDIGASEFKWRMIEDSIGTGEPAHCGDKITIYLMIWSDDGRAHHTYKFAMTLGEKTLGLGVDAGLVGIRKGGERTLILPPAALVRNAHEADREKRIILSFIPTNKMAILTIRRED